jgi:hypothetical protein
VSPRVLAIVVGVVAAGLLIGVAFSRAVLVDDISSDGTRCGLDDCRSCSGSACIEQTPIALAADIRAADGDASPTWGYAGLVAWVAALGTAVALALSLLMVVTGKHVRFPALPTTLIAVGGSVAAFVYKSDIDDAGTIGPIALAVVGIGLALGIAILVTKRIIRYAFAPTTVALLGAVIAMVAGCIFVATRPDMGMARVGLGFWSYAVGILASGFAAVMLSRQLHLIEPEFDPGDYVSPDEDAPGWDEEMR